MAPSSPSPTRTRENAAAEQATRTRLLRTTSRLLQTQGYHGTGLNQILREANAPRGSLYFHFPGGKEQMAVEALEHSATWVTRVMSAALNAGGDDPRAALRTIVETFAGQLARSNFAEGCPFATVALESASLPEALRRTCGAAFAAWQTLLADHLRPHARDDEHAQALAATVLAALEGGLVLAKARHDVAPLKAVARSIDALIPG